MSETHELPKEPVEVNLIVFTSHPHSLHAQEDSQNGSASLEFGALGSAFRHEAWTVTVIPTQHTRTLWGQLRSNVLCAMAALATAQGGVLTQSRSGTFGVRVGDFWLECCSTKA